MDNAIRDELIEKIIKERKEKIKKAEEDYIKMSAEINSWPEWKKDCGYIINTDTKYITNRMLEKDVEVAALIPNLEKHIPKYSPYCHGVKEDNTQYNCPFWDCHPNAEEQSDGYCHLIHNGDWYEENSTMLLWDQCKECGVNALYPDSIVGMILDIFECKTDDMEDNEYYDKLSKAIELLKDYEQEVLENKEYIEEIKKNWKPCGKDGRVNE